MDNNKLNYFFHYKEAPIDHGERFSGRMTAGGVYNQLANSSFPPY